MKDQNELLLTFFEGCTGVNFDTHEEKKIRALTRAVDQVLYVPNLTILTPFAFQGIVITYSVTKSETVVQLLSAWESSGGYTKIHSVLSVPAPSLLCPASTDADQSRKTFWPN